MYRHFLRNFEISNFKFHVRRSTTVRIYINSDVRGDFEQSAFATVASWAFIQRDTVHVAAGRGGTAGVVLHCKCQKHGRRLVGLPKYRLLKSYACAGYLVQLCESYYSRSRKKRKKEKEEDMHFPLHPQSASLLPLVVFCLR